MRVSAVIMLLTLSLWLMPHNSQAYLAKGTNNGNNITTSSVSNLPLPMDNAASSALPDGPRVEGGRELTPALVPTVERTTVTAGRSGPSVGGSATDAEVMGLIRFYSQQFGAKEDLALRIAFAESGYSATARNKTSGACGVFQYLPSTWANTPEGKEGKPCTDPEANVKAAVRHIATKGTSPWNASKHNWDK